METTNTIRFRFTESSLHACLVCTQTHHASYELPCALHIKLPNQLASHPLCFRPSQDSVTNYFARTVGSDLHNRNGPRLRFNSWTKTLQSSPNIKPYRVSSLLSSKRGKITITGHKKRARKHQHVSGNISTILRGIRSYSCIVTFHYATLTSNALLPSSYDTWTNLWIF